MYLEKLKEMFAEVVVMKNASLIADYYHPEFLLHTNEIQMDYQTFLESHQKIFATDIHYSIKYDEETLVEQGEKVAGRLWITTITSEDSAKKIEVILIVQYKAGKLYRIWELTYPDWSKLPNFEEIVE